MNKKALSETDIRSKFITPALCGPEGAGWNLITQLREEAYFTRGPGIVRGKTVRRGEAKFADYSSTTSRTSPLPSSRPRTTTTRSGAGMQQALAYAEARRPFVFVQRRRLSLPRPHRRLGAVTQESPSTSSPRPRPLAAVLRRQGTIPPEQVAVRPGYYADGSRKTPATTSRSPSTARSRPSPRARTASCS